MIETLNEKIIKKISDIEFYIGFLIGANIFLIGFNVVALFLIMRKINQCL